MNYFRKIFMGKEENELIFLQLFQFIIKIV